MAVLECKEIEGLVRVLAADSAGPPLAPMCVGGGRILRLPSGDYTDVRFSWLEIPQLGPGQEARARIVPLHWNGVTVGAVLDLIGELGRKWDTIEVTAIRPWIPHRIETAP